ncbi:AbrB/MazE/SpoVT family DNA-binding domain-containing protein [Amaricoccus tamworthensis]|uniref:AbrB/MazE/SpoVT family DNA-binding domain-containing protein n=1 Tax=Amaricoccus tamworthensis TaxID=57002 RepID=UPI003C7C2647
MRIAKWGNSLAVRLPAGLVKEMGLKEGDQVSLIGDGKILSLSRDQRSDEILENLRRFRGRLPADERIERELAHER